MPPLTGVRVVEFLGLGPAPFASMLLADLGAEVIGVARPQPANEVSPRRSMVRNRPVVEVDLHDQGARAPVLEMVAAADIIVEGFRPGVMERHGLGPGDLRARSPRLIYARMTGWGQFGPLAPFAGHDINYIALTGALHAATRRGLAPVPPANLLGDFGGGGMYLVVAVLAALVERGRTGEGCVLDVAILDGTTYLTSMLQEYRSLGDWSDVAGTNRLDTGAPFYDVYECADGRFVAIGALEDRFFRELTAVLGIDPALCETRRDPTTWPQLRQAIDSAVRGRTRDEWSARAEGTDACISPVLDLGEAAAHPQVAARAILPANRSGTGYEPRLPLGHAAPGRSAASLLATWDLSEGAIAALARGATTQ